MRYDPEKPPAPDAWLALDEDEARQMIARHHRSPRCEHSPAPNQRLHNVTHLIVENQAARSDLPIADALARLVGAGLTRHDAVHAVGSLLSRYLFQALDREAAPPDFDQYYADVRALTAESWQRSAGSDPDPHNAFTDLRDDALLELLFTEGEAWLDFYDEHAIATRQRRWRREGAEQAAPPTPEPAQPNVGRNDPCPCGSGRKYKKCCLGA